MNEQDFSEQIFGNKELVLSKPDADYFLLKDCPLKPEEIDSRYFDEQGSPNEELRKRAQKVIEAVDQILDDSADVYITGGVVKKKPKNEYRGDLDFYVYVKNKGKILKDTPGFDEPNNLASQISILVNGGIRENVDAKQPEYTDVIVSSAAPFSTELRTWPPLIEFADIDYPFRFLFDVRNERWMVVVGKEVKS